MSNGGKMALQLAQVSKFYGDVAALADVSMEVRRGEFLTMLGPSGSGKTTTLRMVAGFVAPTSGRIAVHGKDVADVPSNERNIGMVFQDYALFPHMTVAKNIGYPLAARKVGKAERSRRLEHILHVVGLSGFGDRYPRQLSGGQQQRVALARALVFNPDIVLLDEPMAALDKKLRSTMQLEILQIVKELGATVISVTHDQEEALVMSDRIAVFDKGRLVQIGKPAELYENPSTEFVADFIGDANLLHGKVTVENGQRAICGPNWRAAVPIGNGQLKQMSVGQDVCVVVRPEKMHLASTESGSANLCTGLVHDILYMGVEVRLIVQLSDSTGVQVRLRDIKSINNINVHDRVSFTWDLQDSVVIV